MAVPGSVILLCQELAAEREFAEKRVIQPIYSAVLIEPTNGHSDHLLVIGMRRSLPNALPETFGPGGY